MKTLRQLVTSAADQLENQRVSGVVFATRGKEGDMCIASPEDAPIAVTMETLRRARVAISQALAKFEGRAKLEHGESHHVGTVSVPRDN